MKQSLEERFWNKVNKLPGQGPNGDCWEWTAHKTHGYGMIWYKEKGRPIQASRLSWILHYGDPGKLSVLHKCDNPACVKIEHLFIGSPNDNSKDMVKKQRQANGERLPQSKLTENEILAIRNSPLLQKELAIIYGIDQSTISYIKNNKRWRHI